MVRIETSPDEYHDLATILGRTRKGSATVTVPREAFAHLLIDHSRLCGELRVRIAAPEAEAAA
jgi:hypothetical protein